MAGAKVFISYKHGDARSEALCLELEAALAGAGYDTLIDRSLSGGDRWPDQLYRWVLECAGAIVVANPAARASDWCQREWQVLAARAHATGTRVVPVCIDMLPPELGVLADLQAVMFDDTSAARAVAALGSLRPWQVTPRDYLALHEAWCRYEYETAPVLGNERFSLRDIYQGTECGHLTWEQIGSAKGEVDPFDEKHGGRYDLIETVTRLICDPAFDDAIVIQGPAGAGKSAFTLRIAGTLKALGLETIRLRFRDMRFAIHDDVSEMLADAVRVGPESESSPAPVAALFDEERFRETATVGPLTLCRWVFVLDGWDEVSLAGSSGYQAQLRTWLPKIRELLKRRGPRVRLVITGRPSVEMKESGFLRKTTPLLTVRPLRPDQIEAMVDVFSRKADWPLRLENTRPLLDGYRQWFESRESSSLEMLGLPLLCLLTFRTLSTWQGDPVALTTSPSALYCALVDATAPHAGKHTAELTEITPHRGGKGLRQLLTRTAAMISIGWTERISFDELDARLQDDEDLAEWVEQSTTKDSLHELVVNFYFKGGHTELGCEFLHKSFREYLFAEAIFRAIETCAAGEGPLKPPDHLPYWKDFEPGSPWFVASRKLAALLSPSWLTPEVRMHLMWLIERAIVAQPRRWIHLRDLLTDVYGWWAEGVPLRIQPERSRGRTEWRSAYVEEMARWALPFTQTEANPVRYATLDAHLGYALMQIVAVVHDRLELSGQGRESVKRRYQRRAGDGRVRFTPGEGYLGHILARCSTAVIPFAAQWTLPGVYLKGELLDGVDLSSSDLQRTLWQSVDISRANLSNANLSSAMLHNIDLRSADIANANLHRAELTRCDMQGVNLRNANLHGASMAETDLKWADLSNANLHAASFKEIEMEGARLQNANLHAADVQSTSWLNANCSNANFAEATFVHVVLDGASLANANFDRTRFEHCELESALFASANVTDATFDQCIAPDGSQLTT